MFIPGVLSTSLLFSLLTLEALLLPLPHFLVNHITSGLLSCRGYSSAVIFYILSFKLNLFLVSVIHSSSFCSSGLMWTSIFPFFFEPGKGVLSQRLLPAGVLF